MIASGLLPRSSSNNNIANVNVPTGPWHHSSPSAGFKKLHIKGSPTSDFGYWSRLHRTVTGRRGGMLLGALVSLFSFFMLISFASRLSHHFISPSGMAGNVCVGFVGAGLVVNISMKQQCVILVFGGWIWGCLITF